SVLLAKPVCRASSVVFTGSLLEARICSTASARSTAGTAEFESFISFNCKEKVSRLRIPGDHLARIEDIVGIVGVLQHPHEFEAGRAMLGLQEFHFMNADAMFARTGALHADRPVDQTAVDGLGLLPFGGTVGIDQHLDMEIPIPDMAHD